MTAAVTAGAGAETARAASPDDDSGYLVPAPDIWADQDPEKNGWPKKPEPVNTVNDWRTEIIVLRFATCNRVLAQPNNPYSDNQNYGQSQSMPVLSGPGGGPGAGGPGSYPGPVAYTAQTPGTTTTTTTSTTTPAAAASAPHLSANTGQLNLNNMEE